MHVCMGMDHDGHGSRSESPLEILKRRFASGEITKEQFEDMRRILGEPSPAAHHAGGHA